MRPAQLLAAVVALSSVTAAWPDVLDGRSALARANNMLYGRQDNDQTESETAQATKTAQATETAQATKTEAPKSTAKDADDTPQSTSAVKETGSAKASDKASSTEKQSGSGTGKASTTKTTKAKTTAFDARLPAGGIEMITPAAIAGQQLYKVGEFVTFAWNYTSLLATPTAIDVLAKCTKNLQTYTLAVNQSTKETAMVVWDTGAYQEKALLGKGGVPFLTEKYTLVIYDADLEHPESATPSPGYLAVYSSFQFGMYVPKAAVAWKDFECANCDPSAGLSAFESLTLKALLITSGTTVASLLYFASSFGLI